MPRLPVERQIIWMGCNSRHHALDSATETSEHTSPWRKTPSLPWHRGGKATAEMKWWKTLQLNHTTVEYTTGNVPLTCFFSLGTICYVHIHRWHQLGRVDSWQKVVFAYPVITCKRIVLLPCRRDCRWNGCEVLSYSKIFPLLVSGNAISYWDSSMRERVTSPWVSSCSFPLYLPSDFLYIHSTPSVYITAHYIMQSILNRSLMMYKVMVNCIPTEKHVWMDPRSDRLSQILKTQSP